MHLHFAQQRARVPVVFTPRVLLARSAGRSCRPALLHWRVLAIATPHVPAS